MRRTAEERFWEKVDESGSEDYPECWLWTACTNYDGYGQFRVEGKGVKAHRFSWTLHNGPIPEGMCVLHKCDNPPCMNPDHLWTGTNADNAADRDKKGRYVSAMSLKPHCPQGHSYSGDNLYVVPSSGKRQCRECGRIKKRMRYRKKQKELNK